MKAETLTKADLQKITEALTFWIADSFTNPNNQKTIEVQREYRKLFIKVVRIKNSLENQ